MNVMATPALGDTEFLLGYCRDCEQQVLTHVDLGAHDDEVRRCLHCDAIIADRMEIVSTAELEARGYRVVEARACGNGGGCSAGCGMRARG